MIGITKCEKDFNYYLDWLDFFGADYCVLDLTDVNANEKFDKCSGLILTGGVDIYPEIFCDWETTSDRGKYIPERDGFELNLLGIAVKKKIPLLGICRGCQLINVYFNGSLIYDVETVRNVNHREINTVAQRIHEVSVFTNSLLMDILEKHNGKVTSSHHQAVDRLGEGLTASAKSFDGIIEAIEYADRNQNHFLLGIQWHPERFDDFNDVFSKNIIQKLISVSN